MNTMNQIILCGDIHGQFFKMLERLKRFQIENSYIIHVGDFGVGFSNTNEHISLKALNAHLQNANCHLYVIRGNHDNPSYFQEKSPYLDLERITFLPDYSELNLLGRSILLVGGATSIDRKIRIEGVDWWSDEAFQWKPDFPFKKYDLVVTHTQPNEFGYNGQSTNMEYYTAQDDTLTSDLLSERQEVSKLYEATKPAQWIFGHFHTFVNGQYENTKYRCLDIHELYLYVG